MKYIGAHVSVAGGVDKAPSKANAIGAKAFALFTGSSNRWVSKAISDEQASLFKKEWRGLWLYSFGDTSS